MEWVTHSFTAITGYTWQEDEALGGWLNFILPEDRSGLLPFSERLLAGQPAVAEYRIRDRGGAIRLLRDYCHPVLDPAEGRVVRLYGGVQDITERKRLEEQLRQAQKMEAVGQLAAGVAHDFNNLLTIIAGYSEILLPGLPAADPRREMVSQIRQAGERAALLTRQLLAFSRQTVLEPKIIDLNVVVCDNEKLLLRLIGEDVQLTAVLDPTLAPVKVDPGQVGQVIMNLAVNARDAMPTGGKLTIETGNVVLDEGSAAMDPEARPGRYALLAVTDTGTGMTPEIRAHIFEPFFTTKGPGKGTGLGLATVYGIVKQSGGFIVVYSELGRGTTFKLYFPFAEGRISTGRSFPGIKPIAQGSETILLVEDEDAVRSMVRLMLEEAGYSVLEASRGSEALRLASEHPGPVHLLITDVVMPEMGGRELVERLAGLRREIKVLYLSGYTHDAVVRHGVLQAEVAFLQKPFTMAALANKVREVLDQGTMQASE
jgi:PAS domain S-box-containing protein